MKIKKDIMADVIKQFEGTKDLTNRRYNAFIASLKRAETVEEVMKLKRDFLSALIMSIPMTADTCYFCWLHDNDCYACEYMRKHGKCASSSWVDVLSDYSNIDEVFGDDSDFKSKSSWDKIRDARNFFEAIVLNEYYRGEKYVSRKRKKG